MNNFKAKLDIIGINPFVFVPEKILNALFKESGKDKGPIRVKGTVNGNPFTQTLLRFKGEWRLYINTIMLEDSPRKVGQTIHISIEPGEPKEKLKTHPLFEDALANDKQARKVFESLRPSLQQEIIRYIANLKTEASITKNVNRAISFLKGEGSFVGRKSIE